MRYAYENMITPNENIIKFIDYCYLKNIQYDDEMIDLIRYTIRTILIDGVEYETKELVSNIFSYSMSGMNYIFNSNFDLLNDILIEEVRRIMRQSLMMNALLRHLNQEFQELDDIKLVVPEEELNKIPIQIFKENKEDIKTQNEKCTICQDEFRDNDETRLLKCKHLYHKDCIDNWLLNHSPKCPYCREITTKYVPKL